MTANLLRQFGVRPSVAITSMYWEFALCWAAIFCPRRISHRTRMRSSCWDMLSGGNVTIPIHPLSAKLFILTLILSQSSAWLRQDSKGYPFQYEYGSGFQ